MSQQPKETTNYEVLKHQLILLSKEFQACKSFLDNIKDINSKLDFKRFLQRNIEDICYKLDIDYVDSDTEEDIEDLEDRIDDLERDKEELEEQLEAYKDKFGLNGTLYQDYKIQFFSQYQHQYDAWEIEELLKNGKYFLTQLKSA